MWNPQLKTRLQLDRCDFRQMNKPTLRIEMLGQAFWLFVGESLNPGLNGQGYNCDRS